MVGELSVPDRRDHVSCSPLASDDLWYLWSLLLYSPDLKSVIAILGSYIVPGIHSIPFILCFPFPD